MPEEAILTAVEEDRDHGYTRLTFDEYVPPAAQYDERGNFLAWSDDPFKDWDARAKREVERVIDEKIPAYPGWKVYTDGAQKVVLITLFTLMGDDKWYVINLRTHELNDRNIIEACGQICERYRLPRDRLDMAAFLLARERQSRMLYRWLKVPE